MFQPLGKGTLDRPEDVIHEEAWEGREYGLFLFVPDVVHDEISDVGEFYFLPPNHSLPPLWERFEKPPGTTEAQWVRSAYVVTASGPNTCRVTKQGYDRLKFDVRSAAGWDRVVGRGKSSIITYVSALQQQPSAVY